MPFWVRVLFFVVQYPTPWKKEIQKGIIISRHIGLGLCVASVSVIYITASLIYRRGNW